MKGTGLAGYLMIVNLTMITAATSAALPQQEQGGNIKQDSSAIMTVPETKTTTTPSQPHSDWLSRPRVDLNEAGTRFLKDQKQIWLSPLKFRSSDVEWLLPLAGISSATILTDTSFSKSLPSGRGTLNHFENIRTGSVAGLAAASGGLFLWSFRSHDPHQRETGMLAGEALLDSLIVAQGINHITGRERPYQGNGQGSFLRGGTSFPSNHSAAAWAAAGILAHEYPGSLTKITAYGLAATVSIASVGSKQHSPSDVLIGSGVGWVISEYVYRHHHDPELRGSVWNPLGEMFHDNDSGPTRYPGSAYVPLDSWVYPAFDRLAGLGYLSAGYQGRRPWSREQCAHLLVDVDEVLKNSTGYHPINPSVSALVQELHHEFVREEATFTGPNRSAAIRSVYTRILSASGTVLDDGYHFGQTFAYDYGRPFRQGTNLIAGGSASATYGGLFFYFGGEYQHSLSAPALSNPVRQFIAERDRASLPSVAPFAPINRFQLLDAYAGINLHGWQISFGNESLSWGPGVGGSLLLSNNAAPFPMLRIAPEQSLDLPLLSKVLGPFSAEQFYGRLEGHRLLSQPWIYGQKISMRPFRSLEFAYARTTVIGGTGHPLTAGSFFSSFFGRVDPKENSVPGDSRTAVDWTWRLPGLHGWITFYGELEDDDDPIPLQNLTKSVLRPGIYLPKLPLLPKWDLHFEWTSSTSPGAGSFQKHGNLNYWNLDYTDGYTNNGNLMGNTVGREGITLQAWTRFWISPRNTLDLSWKQSRVLSDFVPGGGKWQDFQASYSIAKRSGVNLKSFVQFEHISSFPLLFPGSRNNFTAGLELGFLPQWGGRGASVTAPNSTQAMQPIGGSLP
jgi:hypothetical protein